MDNHEDEEMIRIILFRKDFTEAVRYFDQSRHIDEKFVRDALIKMGIISYAKPFMKNTGIHKEVKNYRLPSSIVPEDYLWLHEMFLNYRGNFISHSSFKTMQPSLGIVTNTPKGKMLPIQYTDIRFDHWFEHDDEYHEEPVLIDQATKLVKMLIQEIPGNFLTNEEVFSNE
ncbi:MAG: hypothetical protein OEY89_07025 [Gammaproteobacteria bacterium]|nr:hypothetical protein [Gammaproteobacteria bacterium]